MNKVFVSFTAASASFTDKLLRLSFSAVFFSFVVFCAWQPALSRTGGDFPPSRPDTIENAAPVSPRLARSPKADFVDAAPGKYEEHGKNAPEADGDIDAGFNADVSEGFGFVEDTIVQPDDKILIAGSFIGINGTARNYLARLNADGSPDTGFNPGGTGPNGAVLALARQTDGKILIGGSGGLYNGVFRGLMTRLNADGTPDLTFNAGGNANSIVESIAVQADGKILVGGFFSTFNGAFRNRIARLNPDGSLDASFNPGIGFNNPVFSIVPQPDGKILVGGAFRGFNGTPVNGITRLNADGSIDTTFNPGGIGATVSSQVETIVLQPDGKILAGGFFSSFNGTSTPLGVVRLNPNGTVETAFTLPGLRASVTAIALLPNGAILIGAAFNTGGFNTAGGASNGIAILNAPLGSSFAASQANGSILSLTVLQNGKILAGGSFTRYNNEEHRRLVRLNADGTIDNGFAVSVNTAGVVFRVVPQSDGKVLIAGDFESVNGAPRNRLARLNADGSIDTTFNVGSGANDTIFALAVQSDGKILIGGSFTAYNGTVRGPVARINADGSLDTSFSPSPLSPAPVYDIVPQPDGKILVGGALTVQFFDGTTSSSSIARLNANGSIDSTFDTGGISGTVRAIKLLPDGKIFVGGVVFVPQSSNQFALKLIARLNQNGTVDSSFNYPGVGGAVEAIDVLRDGKVLIGGTLIDQTNQFRGIQRLQPDGAVDAAFDAAATVNGTVRALLVQPDGKVLVGGFFSSRVARLNADGSRDTTFNATADNFIDDIAIARDGKILLGGGFTIFNNVSRRGIVRLQGSTLLASRRAMFDYDGDGRADISVYRPLNGVWYLLNSSTGFSAFQFGISTDKIVPADFDGDGKTDIAVYRGNTWYLQRSTSGFASVQFGAAGDIPVPADFDGDGRAELVVYRPSAGSWYTLNLVNNAFTAVQFGIAEDKPVPADFDGDGRADYAVFRPSNGVWYSQQSARGFSAVQFGTATDKPVAADYDGDGKTDFAVYRPAEGNWYILGSARGFTSVQFGAAGDIPAPADFDGDGKTDIAVFRPEGGNWYQSKSVQGFGAVQFGANGDRPTPSAFVP